MESDGPSHPFTKPDADIILRTSDGGEFRVHRLILSLASPVFETMLTMPQPHNANINIDAGEVNLPVVDMAEDAEVLEAILRECYPGLESQASKNISRLIKVFAVADKYEMPWMIRRMEPSLIKFASDAPLRVYAIAHRYELMDAAKLAAKKSLLQPSLEERHPKEFDEMSATAYHHLLVYRQKCTRVLDDLLKNWRDVWSKKGDFAPLPVWHLCSGPLCSRYNSSAMPRLRQLYGDASPWFLDHLERAKDAFRVNVAGSTLVSPPLIQATLEAIRGPASDCRCSSLGPSQLMTFSQRFADAVDKGIDNIPLTWLSDAKK